MNEFTKKFVTGVGALSIAGMAVGEAHAKGNDCTNPTGIECKGPRSGDFGNAQQCLPTLIQAMTAATVGSSTVASAQYLMTVQAAHEVQARVYNVDAMMFVSPRIPKATLVNSSAVQFDWTKLT